jgi:hypothetical protein
VNRECWRHYGFSDGILSYDLSPFFARQPEASGYGLLFVRVLCTFRWMNAAMGYEPFGHTLFLSYLKLAICEQFREGH